MRAPILDVLLALQAVQREGAQLFDVNLLADEIMPDGMGAFTLTLSSSYIHEHYLGRQQMYVRRSLFEWLVADHRPAEPQG